jgi:uncharacterized repeat protein (TIGR03803 family)
MKPSSRPTFAALRTLLFMGFVFGTFAQAQSFTTLYSFTGRDGYTPQAGIVRDKAGNVYGTTWWGGRSDYGVVFKVTPDGTETVLHSFCSLRNCVDGAHPGAPLVPDNTGNIYYGTTAGGGSGTNCGNNGCGAVFKIDTTGNETVLHSFAGGTSDGCHPFQGLVRDTAGNLYGTTVSCGSSGHGEIFRIDSGGNETILHNFAGGSDGGSPAGGHLVMDKAGNMYGLASEGGSKNCNYGCGVLYKLTAKGKFTILHRFAGGMSDGCDPQGSVVQDKAGNLYGTTLECGSNSYGIIWKVGKAGTETILHNFAGGTSDGCYPWAGLARDSKANLFGVTSGCGAGSDGTLYELSTKDTLILLHSFAGTDGANPVGEVLRTARGVMYGTALGGAHQCGSIGCGTVWKYLP